MASDTAAAACIMLIKWVKNLINYCGGTTWDLLMENDYNYFSSPFYMFPAINCDVICVFLHRNHATVQIYCMLFNKWREEEKNENLICNNWAG